MPPPSPDATHALPPAVSAGAPQGDPGAAGGLRFWVALRAIGIALVVLAWALVAHLTSAGDESSGWGAALALAPTVAALALLLWRLSPRWLAAGLGLTAVAGLVGFWPVFRGQVALLYYLEHLGVYLLLSVFFGRTLFGPQESLVTRMARGVHGGVLTPAQCRYTRQVTLAWCLFFAGMASVSTVLFVFAPVAAWSIFANLLGGPLIALMFVGEYQLRRRFLPEEQRASMADAVRAWKAQRGDGAP